MSSHSRTEAQKRSDEIQAFRHEWARLLDEGVITLTELQQRAVTDHHQALLHQLAASFDIDRDERSRQLSLGMRVASLFGAVALAVGVVFLFNQFWGRFGTTTQIAILVAASVATFAATIVIRDRDTSGYFGSLAATVACACFAVNVSMLGRIFDIAPSELALLAVGAYTVVLAYACETRLLLAAGLSCLIVYVGAQIGSWSGMVWLDFSERPENLIPAAVALFAVPSLVDHRRFHGFALTYRAMALLTIAVVVLTLSHYGAMSWIGGDRATIQTGYQLLGFSACVAAFWFGMQRRLGDLVKVSVSAFVVLLYGKFYEWWWDSMPSYLFFLLLGAVALGVLMTLRRLRSMTSNQPVATP
jgi:hypothetical protein